MNLPSQRRKIILILGVFAVLVLIYYNSDSIESSKYYSKHEQVTYEVNFPPADVSSTVSTYPSKDIQLAEPVHPSTDAVPPRPDSSASVATPDPNPKPIDFLPLKEAEQFCQHRRWNSRQDRSKPRKVYDLILINTELEWLEIRLGQMYNNIDYFIIVEAALTFQDNPKPLYVQEHWDSFKPYHAKMIRHTLNTTGVEFKDTWHREQFSRNAMYDQVIPFLTGAQAANEGDVILVSDVDEMPRPSTITALRNCEFPKKLSLHSHMYYYSFQWVNRQDWPHPQATYYSANSTVLPDELRSQGEGTQHLYNAAWHCSYCFSTIKEMVSKIKSFSHQELNQDRFKDPKEVLRKVRTGIDMYERAEEIYDRVEDNRDVPEFIRKSGDKLKYMLDRDPENGNFLDL